MRARQGAILQWNHDVLMSTHTHTPKKSLKCNRKIGYYADETETRQIIYLINY